MATLMGATACSSDTETAAIDSNEQYTREFIKQFGVPASGHDYSMATTAGLHVSTAKGGSVMVTAEVNGKEYLFANLTVPAGTHAIPVTIPRSVTELKVKTGLAEYVVAPDATVDIDRLPSGASSREGNWSVTLGNDGINIVDSDEDGPTIVFNTSDFLDEFLEEHPIGSDNTIYKYYGDENGGAVKIDDGGKIPVFYGETELSGLNAAENGYIDAEYYIFPIWWKQNKYGNKNYRLMVYEAFNVNRAYTANFGNGTTATKPFPQLGYSTGSVSYVRQNNENMYADISNTEFIYPGDSDNEAFPRSNAKSVISRGIKVSFNDFDGYLGFCLGSGTGAYINDYVFSSPRYNISYWGSKIYYDIPLSHLFLAYSGTMQYPLDELEAYIKQGNKDSFIRLNEGSNVESFILGFNSAPQTAGDRSARDYSDLLLLFIPTRGVELLYLWKDAPDPLTWTIAAEDLGGSFDWDFNDAVFQFTDVVQNLNSVNKNSALSVGYGPTDAVAVHAITVTPLASGGTMPLYITYTGDNVYMMPDIPADGDQWYSDVNNAIKESLASDKAKSGTFILGKELHKWLGASTHTSPVNVGAKRQNHAAQSVQFALPYNGALGTAAGASTTNSTLAGFAILVDKENTLNIDALNDDERGLRHAPHLSLGKDTYLIGAPVHGNGDIAPQMILLENDWEWPQELVNIRDAYPGFETWLSTAAFNEWISNGNSARITKK